MKFVKEYIRPAIVITLLLTFVTGLLYPGIVTGLAQLIFPGQANGSLVTDGQGHTLGSALIGQEWKSAQYFHGRPSATVSESDSSKSVPYNAQNSSPSNLGPTNPALIKTVQQNIDAVRKENPGESGSVPVDLVTASGSGLDPDISVAGALYQVKRVANARGLSESRVTQMVQDHVQHRFLGMFGEEHVNVFELNRALDGVK